MIRLATVVVSSPKVVRWWLDQGCGRRVVQPIVPNQPSVIRVKHGFAKSVHQAIDSIHLAVDDPCLSGQSKSGDRCEPVHEAEPSVKVEQILGRAPVAGAPVEPAKRQGFGLQHLFGVWVELGHETENGSNVHVVDQG